MTASATEATRVWVTRARPGAARTADRLTDLGLQPVIAPLIALRPLKPDLPDLAGFDGLVFTSVNGVSALVALVGASASRTLPVFAVGRVTARAAEAAGFPTVHSADGDVRALAALIRKGAPGARLLHPGAREPAGDLAGALRGAGEVQTLPVYEAVASDIAPPAAFDIVLVHSPRAARELAARLPAGQATGRAAVVLSAACAEPLKGLDFAVVRVAGTPDETGLLTALKAALGKPPPAV